MTIGEIDRDGEGTFWVDVACLTLALLALAAAILWTASR